MTELNYLDNLEITYTDLEESIENMQLVFYSHKERYVENYNFEPCYFVYAFNDYVIEYNKLPSQKEYAKYYIRKNLKILQKGFLINHKLKKDYLLKTLVYRLYRAYPSFVRDLHFSIFLKDKLKSRDIYSNPYMDVMKGIDILIDNKYAVHLYTNTSRAIYYRNKKHKRHEKDNLIHIDIPIDFKSCYKCGNFFLYRDREVLQLLNKLNEFEKIRI